MKTKERAYSGPEQASKRARSFALDYCFVHSLFAGHVPIAEDSTQLNNSIFSGIYTAAAAGGGASLFTVNSVTTRRAGFSISAAFTSVIRN